MHGSTNKLDDILGAVYRKDLSSLTTITPADVNMKDQDGRTPLMHAILAEDADPAIVRLLISRGADVNVSDGDQKWTALHFAARDQNVAVVWELLDAGATADPVDVFGNTPLWRAVMSSPPNLAVIKELLKHGASPHQKNKHGVAPADIARDTGQAEIVTLFESQG